MTDQGKIDYVLDRFDAHKVHSVMYLLNWEWARTNGVPYPEDIREEARRLLWSALQHSHKGDDSYEVRCGGLSARYNKDADFLSLGFCVSHSTFSKEECDG